MATVRPFAYNPSLSAITGTTQSGNIAVGVSALNYSSNPGGVKWFMGPDEDNGYVVALAVTGGNYSTPDGANNGTVEFWRSAAKTDESFVSLANVLSNELNGSGPFASASSASTWLNSINMWSSWVPAPAGVTSLFYFDAGHTGSYPGSGTTIYNIGTAGNAVGATGSISGASYNSGIASGVFDFDGITDKITFGQYNFGNIITVNAWVYPRTETSINCLMSNAVANTQSLGFKMSWNNWNTTNYTMNFEAGNGSAGNTTSTASNTVTVNTWQMLTFIFNKTAQTIKFYKNGVEIATASGGGTVANIGMNNSNWWMGSIGGNSYYMNAYMGAFKLWNTALAASDILDEFNNTKSRYGL